MLKIELTVKQMIITSLIGHLKLLYMASLYVGNIIKHRPAVLVCSFHQALKWKLTIINVFPVSQHYTFTPQFVYRLCIMLDDEFLAPVNIMIKQLYEYSGTKKMQNNEVINLKLLTKQLDLYQKFNLIDCSPYKYFSNVNH